MADGMRLYVRLLGGFQAVSNSGLRGAIPTGKVQALLARLALPPGRAHARDQLAALLWGDLGDAEARSNLRQALFALRRALPASPVLITEGDNVALDPSAVEVDVALFERRVVEGTATALQEAAELYQGDLLAGLAVSEPGFEEWLLLERERLRELAIDALAKLLVHQRSARIFEAAVRTGLRLVALDPLQESVHRTLMRLYAELGRRAAALRQYQVCVGVLRRELGVEPEAETKQLYQELLRRPAEATKAPDSRDSRVRPAQKRAPARLDLPVAETPLFGRETELGRLRRLLDETIGGHGHVATVMGEAGIGKTRLLGALAAEAVQRGCRVLMGRCHESDSILPFGPWVDACRRGELSADEELLGALHPTWRAEVTRLLPESTAPGLPLPSDSDLRLFEGMAKLVEQLAAREPLVLMLEDLHWADEMSLRLLAFVSRRISTWPALVVTTAREEELAEVAPARRTLGELDSHPGVTRLSLAPLPRATVIELTRYLARVGSNAGAGAQLEAQVWVVSEGNPFVVIETMRAIQDGTIPSESTRLPLAERVRAMTAARLERLSAPARQLAAVAAVIGSEFEFPVVQRASGLDETSAAEGVEELVRRRVMHGVGDHFDFVHHRLQAVAYDRLLPPRRKLLHRSVGEALEALASGDLARDPLALGRHFREGKVWDKTVTYLSQAGAEALVRSANREAVTCFEQALAALGHLPETPETLAQALDVRFDLRRALYPLGAFELVVAYLREAEGPARRLGDQRRLGQLFVHMCQTLVLAGHPTEAIACGENAQTIAESLGDVGLQVGASLALGGAYSRTGDYRQAEDLLLKLLQLLEGDPSGERSGVGGVPITQARSILSLICADQGWFAKGIAHGQEGLRLAEALDNPTNLATVCFYLSYLQIARGELYQAVGLAERGLALARQWNLPYFSVLHSGSLGYAYALLGRTAESLPLLEHAMNALGTMGHRSAQALLIVRLGEACVLADRLEDALEFAGRALALARERGQRGHEAWALRLLGEVAAHRDPPELGSAESAFREAVALAAQLGMRPLVAHCHLGLGKLYRRTDNREQAHERLATATTMYREMGMTYWLEKAEAEMRELG